MLSSIRKNLRVPSPTKPPPGATTENQEEKQEEEKATPVAAPSSTQLPTKLQDLYEKVLPEPGPGSNRDTAGSRFELALERGDKPIQLYSLGTPNGQKVGIALEEFGFEYDAHCIDILSGDQFSSGFVELNPNSKIPAIYAQDEDVSVFETGAILLYLSERAVSEGKPGFFPQDPKQRAHAMSWLMWNIAGQGPMSGQFGHFYLYAPPTALNQREYAVARFGMEVKRLLSVIEKELATHEGKDWFLGAEYSIVDMAVYPWVVCLGGHYKAGEFLSLETDYPLIQAWMKRMAARPGVERGMEVCNMQALMEMRERRKKKAEEAPSTPTPEVAQEQATTDQEPKEEVRDNRSSGSVSAIDSGNAVDNNPNIVAAKHVHDDASCSYFSCGCSNE